MTRFSGLSSLHLLMADCTRAAEPYIAPDPDLAPIMEESIQREMDRRAVEPRPLHASEIHAADCDCDGDFRDGEMVQIVGKRCREAREEFEKSVPLGGED